MDVNKTHIRMKIKEGQLLEAAQLTADYADRCGLSSISDGLTVIQNNLANHRIMWNTQQVSPDEISRAYARIAFGVNDYLNQLPDFLPHSPKKPYVLTESVFKNRLFYTVLAAKGVSVFWLIYLWQTGGFNREQALDIMYLLAPVFVVLLSAKVVDQAPRKQEAETQSERYLAGPLLGTTAWLVPAYFIALLILPVLKVKGDLSFTAMNTMIAVAECLLASLVGNIAFTLYKKS